MANHDSVAHNWANKTGRARKGFNIYYEGDTIYSYGTHFPIARHHKGYVLVTTQSYSASTSKHISLVWRALNYGRDCLTIKVDDVHNENPPRNLKGILKDVDDALLSSAGRRTAFNRAFDIERAIERHRDAVNFAKLNGLSQPNDLPADLEKHAKSLREKDKEEIKAEKELLAEKKAKVLAEYEKSLKDWRSLKKDYLRSQQGAPIALRVNGTHVETTWGAKVSLSAVKRALSMVTAAREAGESVNWESSPHVAPLDINGFPYAGMDKHGVKFGCHKIEWPEVDLLIETIRKDEQGN